MPIITGPAGMDPILGEMRTIDISGGTGGGGGSDYTFNSSEFTVSITGLVSIKTIDASKITGKVGSAGVADALINGATVGFAQSAGTATTATNATSATSAGTAGAVTTAVSSAIISEAVSSAGSSLDVASVSEVMSGVTGGTQKVVDVTALRGGLTAGQAVDVTSKPDDFDTGAAAGTYKGLFLWNRDYTLGFASFPKFATGLKYLLVADVQATEDDATVTPGGTWLSGGSSAISLPNGVYTRIAMLFDSESACVLTFSGTDPIIKNLREYEVTSCSNEAIAYIAALGDPDSFQDYYLVKRDMVSPWSYIIQMGEASMVTIAAGLAYEINLTGGTTTITTDVCPTGYVGRDTYVRLIVGSGTVVAQAPLKLGTAVVPNAINNCTVRYRDGEAILVVDDTIGGYVVTLSTGTGEGTLYYGLTTPGVSSYISIANNLVTADMGGAVTNGEKRVIGNGSNGTAVTGSVSCTSNTIFTNAALDNVTILGGTMTLADSYVTGGTVFVSSGTLSLETAKVDSGASVIASSHVGSGGSTFADGKVFIPHGGKVYGGVYDLQRTNVSAGLSSTGAACYISGATFANGFSQIYGGALMIYASCTLDSCTIVSGSNPSARGAIDVTQTCVMTNCAVIDNPGRGINCRIASRALDLENSIISGNAIWDISAVGIINVKGGCKIGLATGNSTFLMNIAGTNTLDRVSCTSGNVVISSGASINLTSSIIPGANITVMTGGCTVNGAAIAAGTYTAITSSGGSAVAS